MTASRSEIDQIKRSVDLATYVRSRGIALEKRGSDLVGICPFHADSSPSLIITPAKNLYHCFSCGAGGDVIEFVMKLDHLEFPAAVSKLREYAGISNRNDESANDGGKGEAVISPAPEEGEKLEEAAELSEITPEENKVLLSVVEHYRRNLKESGRAKEYLTGRGIGSGEVVEKFQIGYSPEGLMKTLPSPETKEGKRIRAILKKYGIIHETGREHFRSCVTFPIIDEQGVFRGMYGRRLAPGARVRHLYTKGMVRGIYNPAAFSQEELIVTESIIDALTFYKNGIRNVTCVYGVNGYSADFHEALLSSNIKRVILALDSDVPGRTATEKIAGRLRTAGIEVYTIAIPSQMDVNEYALAMPPAEDSLRELIQNALPYGGTDEFVVPRARAYDTFSLAENGAADGAVKSTVERGPSIPKRDTISPLKECPPATGEEDLPDGKPRIEKEEVKVRYGDRRYRVRGLFRNQNDHVMKINLKVSYGDLVHVDTLDFLSAKARFHFLDVAATELGLSSPDIIKTDLARLLDALERIQEDRSSLARQTQDEIFEIPEDRKRRALEYLKSPDLVRNIVSDFEKTGLVGERINSLMGYLGALSRKTEKPLAIIVQSASAAGKTTLMDAILKFVPPEDRVKYSMMTGQSLYYMYSKNLQYTIIAISEDQGMEKAMYAIKLLQSERKIVIVTTIKDPVTGLPDTKEFEVEGPVMFLITSTNAEIDEELQNRCFILTVNESEAQTRLIQMLQRRQRTRQGLREERQITGITELHEDVQRLLKAYPVEMPFAMDLDFPAMDLRARRDHMKFLTLIESIALLHQYQRDRYIEDDIEHLIATEEDVALAAFLLGEVFGISVHDLAPQTKRLLDLVDKYVKERCEALQIERRQFRFTRRELREHIYWSNTRLRKHLDRLEELEYVLLHGGGQGKLAEYELLYDGSRSEDINFVPGLINPAGVEIDPALLTFLREPVPEFFKSEFQNGNLAPQNGNLAPQNANLAPTWHPLSTPLAPPGVPGENPVKQSESPVSRKSDPTLAKFQKNVFKAEKNECHGLGRPGSRTTDNVSSRKHKNHSREDA